MCSRTARYPWKTWRHHAMRICYVTSTRNTIRSKNVWKNWKHNWHVSAHMTSWKYHMITCVLSRDQLLLCLGLESLNTEVHGASTKQEDLFLVKKSIQALLQDLSTVSRLSLHRSWLRWRHHRYTWQPYVSFKLAKILLSCRWISNFEMFFPSLFRKRRLFIFDIDFFCCIDSIFFELFW